MSALAVREQSFEEALAGLRLVVDTCVERHEAVSVGRVVGKAPLRATTALMIPGAEIVYSPSPFKPGVRRMTLPAGATIEDAVAQTGVGPRLHKHLAVYAGDVRIPRAMWAHVRPKPGAALYIRPDIAGGGGQGGKNPLKTILALAVVVLAVWTGGLAGSLFTAGSFLAVAASTVVTAAVLTAGTMLVNALIPPPKARNDFAFDQQPGNPYGSLTGIRNQFAPYAPIPRVLGERRMYPLLAARPYTEHQGNTQYLRMLLLVGYGPLDISDIRIGTTPISAFPGAQVEIREGWADDTPVTLYTRLIHEDPLSILLEASAANVRSTQTGTTEVSLDVTLPNGLATYDSKGARQSRTVAFTVQYSADGVSWSNANWIEGDSAYGTGSNGVLTVTDASASAVIRSGRFAVPSAGTYQVRVTRTTAAGGASDVDQAYWSVLRSIKPDAPVNKAGLCLIAIRLQATAQLNGAPDTINCLAKSYLPVYDADDETWAYSLAARSNPAWQYADVFRRRGLSTVLPDSRVDLPAILAWANDNDETAPNAAEKRWTCDLVLEGGSIHSAAQVIAAHGRGQPTVSLDGKYSVVRDVPQTVPVQHISPRNSSNYRGSKAFLDRPHALRTKFINPAKSDAYDEVIVYDDGYNADGSDGKTAASKFDTLEFPGARSDTLAWREGRYHLGVLKLRPEEHAVDMDFEALACRKGSLVRFSHDVISIGLGSARISARTLAGPNITHLTLDAPVDMETGKTYAVRVRHSDGTSTVHVLETEEGQGLATLALTTPVLASTGPAIGDLVMFGEHDLESAPMIVKSIDRASEFQARVTMVDAAAGVHTADTGTIPAFESHITHGADPGQTQPAAPSFTLSSDTTALQRLSDGTLIERIKIALKPPAVGSVQATRWQAEYRRASTGDESFTQAFDQPVSSLTGYVFPVVVGGSYDIRARTLSATGTPSDWTSSYGYEVTGLDTTPPDVTGFAATPGAEGAELSWDAADDVDLAFYEIRRGGASWDDADPVAKVVGVRAFVKFPGLTSVRFWIKAVNSVGTKSVNAAYVDTIPDMDALAEMIEERFVDAFDAIDALKNTVLSQSVRQQHIALNLAKLGYLNGAIPLGVHLDTMTTLREEGDEAIAETIALLGAANILGTAFILDTSTAYVGPSESLASRFSTMSAATSAAAAAVTTEQTARISADGVLAASISTVSASLGTLSSSVTTLAAASSTMGARWGVQLNVGGYITGILTNNTGSTSDFTILTDKFYVVDPGGGTPRTVLAYAGGVLKMHDVEVDTIKADTITANEIVARGITDGDLFSGSGSGGSAGDFVSQLSGSYDAEGLGDVDIIAHVYIQNNTGGFGTITGELYVDGVSVGAWAGTGHGGGAGVTILIPANVSLSAGTHTIELYAGCTQVFGAANAWIQVTERKR